MVLIYDIITCGSSTIDVFGKSDSDLIKIKTHSFEKDYIAYPCGVKLLIKELDFKAGGGGINSAVVCSRLGLKSAYLGSLGNDSNGLKIIDHLAKKNIDFIGNFTGHQTGYSIILNSMEHDRTILKFSGANDHLYYKDIDKSRIFSKWIYLTSMVDESYKTLESLSSLAKKRKIKVAFNPSNYVIRKGRAFLSKIMKNTDVFLVNRHEAEMLCHEKDIKKQLSLITKMGPRMAVITDGPRGAAFSDRKASCYIKAHPIKAVEVTGAGDTFGSSFVAGLIIKGDYRFALKLALANAESVIQTRGAHEGILPLAKAMIAARKPAKIISLGS